MKVLLLPHITTAERLALVNIPAGTKVFDTDWAQEFTTRDGGPTPSWKEYYENGADEFTVGAETFVPDLQKLGQSEDYVGEVQLNCSGESSGTNNTHYLAARGLIASKEAIETGDNVASLIFAGHDSIKFMPGASITVDVDDAVSVGSAPMGMTLRTSNLGNDTSSSITMNSNGSIEMIGARTLDLIFPSGVNIGTPGGNFTIANNNAFDEISPSTTKGDIIVYDGSEGPLVPSNVRFPVGPDSYSLTADSTTSTGLAWRPQDGKFSQTGVATIENSAAEESLISSGVGSLTIAAGAFKAGDAFTVKIGGKLRTNGINQTIDIRIKSGASILAETGAITLKSITSLQAYEIELDFVIKTIGPVAWMHTNGNFTYLDTAAGGAYQGAMIDTDNISTFDTTVSNTLDVTLQWGAADANNIINSSMTQLYKTY